MSLWFYKLFFLGVVFGGMLLLVTFSLLAMARKGEDYQDRLEYDLSRGQGFPPDQAKAGPADNARAHADSKLGQGSGVERGIFLSH